MAVTWFRAALVLALLASAHSAYAEKLLRRGNGAEPHSIDPHRALTTSENSVIGDMFMGLYTDDAAGTPVLGAADAIETSKDGLTWTFKIRPHTWSDGSAVTADDFVFAFRRLLAQETAAEYASILYPVKNALQVNKGKLATSKLGVSAPDPATFVIQLEHPAPYLPQLLTHYTAFPVPKAVVEKLGNAWTRPANIVVNGAYKLKGWRPHDHIELVKNPLFYDATNVKIDRVIFYPIDDDSAALKRFRAGELDTQARWPISEFKWLSANAPGEARRTTALRLTFVSFNLLKKPFNDLRVRKAISLAIDGKTLARDVYQGVYGEAANSFVPAGTANIDHSPQVEWADWPMEKRLAESRRLLAEAGYGAGKRLKFTYRFIGNADIKRGAVALQAMWRKVGIDVEVQASEEKVHWNLLEVRDFEVAYNAWLFDYNDAKNLFLMFQVAAAQLNNSAYESAKFESLLQQSDSEPDVQARAKLLGQANAVLLADLPSVPLMFPYQRHLVKNHVLNWSENARDVNRTRWLDLDEKPVTTSSEAAPDDNGGFWSWIGSWFSAEAWSKWWNS